MQRFYYFVAKKKILFLSILLMIFILIVFNLLEDNNSKKSLDIIRLELTFSRNNFLNVLNELGINLYKKVLIADTFFPAIYSLFISSLIGFLNKENKINFIGLIFFYFPFIAAFFDYIENYFHFKFLNNLNDISDFNVLLSGICSSIKFFLLFLSFLYLSVLLINKKALTKSQG